MLRVYRASAGAGKTFALTMEYFKIVFNSPTEYKNVLAVTFTNKATEEMKSRIVRELNKLAEGQKSDYRDEIQRTLKLTAEQVRERAGVLRTLILHDYGRLSVTTIDRFFQRVIKAFTRELGIFPGYNVELDSDYVLQRAVDQVMQRMNRDKELGAWIQRPWFLESLQALPTRRGFPLREAHGGIRAARLPVDRGKRLARGGLQGRQTEFHLLFL